MATKTKNKKTVLSPESQKLLEQIFDFFGGRKEAKKDPGLCLLAMLDKIKDDLVTTPVSGLRMVLDRACVPGAIENFREKLAEKGKRRKVMA